MVFVVSGSGLSDHGVGCWRQGVKCIVQGTGCMGVSFTVQCSGFTVSGSRILGFDFRVRSFGVRFYFSALVVRGSGSRLLLTWLRVFVVGCRVQVVGRRV
jgi:hypothetical protein